MERSLSLIAILVYQALCFSDRNFNEDAAKAICNGLRPSYALSDAGFYIKSRLIELEGSYTPGQQYNVDLIGLISSYEGFMVQARDRWNKDLILGSFTPLDTTKAHTIRCLGNEHGTVTHKTKDPVTIQRFIWQAPPTLEGSGEVDFVASIVQNSSISHQWISLKTTPSGVVARRYRNTDGSAGDMAMNTTDEMHSIMVRVHGVLMTVAFSIFGVFGIFFAAWMKPVLAQDHKWFQIHRAMMVMSLLLGIVGFICIFIAHRNEMFNGFYGLVSLNNPGDITHFVFSFIIMFLLIANPIIAVFRCKPNAPRRWIYNLIHGAIVGQLFQVLILANSCVGLYLLGGSTASLMLYIYVFFSFFTVVVNIVLGFFIVQSGSGDLPAVAKLLCSILQKRQNVAPPHVESGNDQVDEENVLLADKKSSGAEKLPIATFVPVPTLSNPPPSAALNSTRWEVFRLYILISLPLLLLVVVMITTTIPS